MEIIRLTEAAQQQAKQMLDQEIQRNPEAINAGLRIGVVGGGCSGLQYSLHFANSREDDFVFGYGNGLKIIVDPKSATLLTGASMDFHSGLNKSGFDITNPAATNSCGCGKSFAV